MRHGNHNRKFGRVKSQRSALLKGLVLSLIKHGRIETSEAKAKELRPYMEKLVTKANEGTLHSTRQIVSRLYGRTAEAKTLIEKIAPKYKGRTGGYTRITKLGERAGDASKMSVIEFV
ncbi:MAG: ribosomal protein large subunit ribosomal protein [Candidatus Parcubacteria bacterium]|jgi:large subunit ribosomal protein L17